MATQDEIWSYTLLLTHACARDAAVGVQELSQGFEVNLNKEDADEKAGTLSALAT